jgi:hypothetical protein
MVRGRRSWIDLTVVCGSRFRGNDRGGEVPPELRHEAATTDRGREIGGDPLGHLVGETQEQ